MALTPGLLGQLRESFINRNLRWPFQMSDHVRPVSPDYSKHTHKKKKVAKGHIQGAYLVLQRTKKSVTAVQVCQERILEIKLIRQLTAL